MDYNSVLKILVWVRILSSVKHKSDILEMQCWTPCLASQNLEELKISVFPLVIFRGHSPMLVIFEIGSLQFFDLPLCANCAAVSGFLTTSRR
jgi:hypothetical protein